MGCIKKEVNRRTSSEHRDGGEGDQVSKVFLSLFLFLCLTETFEYYLS